MQAEIMRQDMGMYGVILLPPAPAHEHQAVPKEVLQCVRHCLIRAQSGRSELGYVRLAQQRAEDAEKCMRTATELEAAAPALPFCELPPALS